MLKAASSDPRGCLVFWHRPGFHPGSVLRALRHYLCQPVPQRLDHDAAIVITLVLVGSAQLFHPEAGDSKQAQVVPEAQVQRGDEVREAEVWLCAGRVLLGLKIQGAGGGVVSTDGAAHTVDSSGFSSDYRLQTGMSVCTVRHCHPQHLEQCTAVHKDLVSEQMK